MARKLIAGNWKMNGLLDNGQALVRDLIGRRAPAGDIGRDVLICPPAHLLHPLAGILAGSGIALGGQDCHAAVSGAHTGDLSAAMLRDAGCDYVLVGHSERRRDHGEGDADVRAKAAAAQAAGLVPIVCVGETEAERDAGQTLTVIERQVRGSLTETGGPQVLVMAYEPVWAIGTGKVAEPRDVAEVHAHIRGILAERHGAGPAAGIRVLYGGSLKPGNAGALLALPNVDGALVGGASLKAADFWAIARASP